MFSFNFLPTIIIEAKKTIFFFFYQKIRMGKNFNVFISFRFFCWMIGNYFHFLVDKSGHIVCWFLKARKLQLSVGVNAFAACAPRWNAWLHVSTSFCLRAVYFFFHFKWKCSSFFFFVLHFFLWHTF